MGDTVPGAPPSIFLPLWVSAATWQAVAALWSPLQ